MTATTKSQSDDELTTGAAAKIAGVTSWTICRWIQSGLFEEDGYRKTASGRFFVKQSALREVMGK
jgi:hypothetical protein